MPFTGACRISGRKPLSLSSFCFLLGHLLGAKFEALIKLNRFTHYKNYSEDRWGKTTHKLKPIKYCFGLFKGSISEYYLFSSSHMWFLHLRAFSPLESLWLPLPSYLPFPSSASSDPSWRNCSAFSIHVNRLYEQILQDNLILNP